MDKIFDTVAQFLSRPRGFVFIHVVMVLGYFTLPTEVFTMALSVLAISMTEFILVSNLKGDLALHLKLDKLIEASDATNDMIGEEKKRLKDIEQDTKSLEEQGSNHASDSGKAVVVGYDYNVTIDTQENLFPSGATFTAQIRSSVDSGTILGTLSTAGGTLVRVDDNSMTIKIPGSMSLNWTSKTIVLDIIRTDTNPDQYVGIKITLYTETPVTRGL